jgi:anti-anti-sigma factor
VRRVDVSSRLTVVGDRPVVELAGELDLASIAVLRDVLLRAVGEHPGAVVAIDLDGVTVLDDTALGVLLGTAARAREHGGDIILVCTTKRLLDRFELSGLARAIEVRPALHS